LFLKYRNNRLIIKPTLSLIVVIHISCYENLELNFYFGFKNVLMNAKETFNYLINPIKEADFFYDFWEKEVLHISRNDKKYFANFIERRQIDDWFQRSILTHPTVQVRGNAQNPFLWSKDTINFNSFDGKIINKNDLIRFFRKGNPILVKFFSQYDARFNSRMTELKNFFRGKDIVDNLIISPAKNNSFSYHYDKEHVFVIQLSGEKKWYLYNKMAENLRGEGILFPLDEHTNVKIMQPGDMLYIPAGMHHHTETVGDENSISISISIDLFNGEDLLQKAIKNAYLDFPNIRKMIPPPHASKKEKKEFYQLLKKDFIQFIEKKSFEDILMDLEGEEMEKYQPFNSFFESTNYSNVSMETRLMHNEGIRLSLHKDDKLVRLKCNQHVLTFFGIHESAVRYIVTHNSFSIKDVPVLLPPDKKKKLIKQLINIGLLKIIED